MRVRTRRRIGTAVATGVAALGLVAASPTARADDGLTIGADSRYVVDPEDEVVHATVQVDLRNITPDRTKGGNVYYYYFNGFKVPVPAGAESLRATSDGGSLSVSTESTKDPSTVLASIAFPDLRYGQERRIELSFDVPGAPHRSEDLTRVGPGFATFVAVGPGDPGKSSVTIEAPAVWDFTSTAAGFDEHTVGSTRTYTLDKSTDDLGIWSVVSFRDPDETRKGTVTVGKVRLALAGFPDDARWTGFVKQKVTAGLPELEKLVGNPWPGGLETIREDASPSLLGYDGWFDPSDHEIVVGEQLDDDLIYHELSHAWLGDDTFVQRWLYEGLAQTTAERAVEGTGGRTRPHPQADRSAKAAIPLNRWEGGASSRASDVDTYAYPAAYRAMKDLLGNLDDERYAAVVGAAIRGETAYDRPGSTMSSAGRTTWNDWLDLLETRGRVKDAAKVLSTWALTPAQKKELPVRARARTAYSALDRADGAWAPPLGLREAMAGWHFDVADEVRGQVAGLGRDALAVQRAGTSTGLGVPRTVRAAYERADSATAYTALAATLPRAASAITEVGRAHDVRTATRDPFTALGARVLGVDERADRAVTALRAGKLDEARAAAREVAGRSSWILPLGIAIPLAALLVLIGLVLLGAGLVRRARRRRALAPGTPTDPSAEPSGSPAV